MGRHYIPSLALFMMRLISLASRTSRHVGYNVNNDVFIIIVKIAKAPRQVRRTFLCACSIIIISNMRLACSKNNRSAIIYIYDEYTCVYYITKDPLDFELLPVPRETRRIGRRECVRISVRNASVMDTLKRVYRYIYIYVYNGCV